MGGMNRARSLRKNPTDAEMKLWKRLCNRQTVGNKFRRQHPVGPYIVDFACLEKGLVVEVDGGQHGENVTYDSERSAYLEAKGFRVFRFWNNDVLTQIEVVKEVIMGALG